MDSARVVYDLIPPQWRYGRAYKKVTSLLMETETWSLDRLIEFQERRLSRLIRHCYSSVPYYQELFRQNNIAPADVTTIADLHKIPFLTKDVIRRRKRQFIAENFSFLDHDPESTSGTTGAPFDFWIDRQTRAMERALALRVLQWLGYTSDNRVAELKEDRFENPNTISKYYPGSKHLKFSFFRANDAKLRLIAEELASFRPTFIKAFPSSLYILSRWMERNRITIPTPKYIVTSSENLYPSVRELAGKVFQAPVIDFYGQNEKVATAFQCTFQNGYHLQMEQAIVELVPLQGGDFEIVGTSLDAFGMPFLRYKTSDITTGFGELCSCGRSHLTLKNICGRSDEILVNPELEIIAPVSMDYAFYHFEGIKEAQVVQDAINHIDVSIVPWETITEKEIEKLRSSLLFYLNSSNIEIDIRVVDEIQRSGRGKKPFVISKINLDEIM